MNARTGGSGRRSTIREEAQRAGDARGRTLAHAYTREARL